MANSNHIPIYPIPNIVVNQDHLCIIGKVGSYYELKKYQNSNEYQHFKLSNCVQKSHNMPHKTWQVMEVSKNNRPVMLLDSITHKFLYKHRLKLFKNMQLFQDEYSYNLVENGLIDANDVWTTMRLPILEPLGVEPNSNLNTRHYAKVIQGLKHLQLQENEVLQSWIEQDLQIPMANSGRFLITRKVVATIHNWYTHLKKNILHQTLHEYKYKTANSTLACWSEFAHNANNLAKLYSSNSKLDLQIREYAEEDLKRCVVYVGNLLDKHKQVNLKPMIKQTMEKIQSDIKTSIENIEYTKLVQSHTLHDPYITSGQTLCELLSNQLT